MFPLVFREFVINAYETLTWPQLLMAVLEQASQNALGSQGELALARLRADLCVALDDADEETEQ